MPYPSAAVRPKGGARARVQTVLTLQPDATAGQDTITAEGAPTTAFGTDADLWVRTQAGVRNVTLIKFDLSSVPGGATVDSAVLSLWLSTAPSASNVNVGVFALLSANTGWTESSTWDYKTPSTVRWAGDAGSNGGADAGCTQSGTDYNSSAMATQTVNTGTAADTKFDFTLDTTQMAAMIANNYGMVIYTADAATNNLTKFRSSDYVTDSTKRPKLVVTYTS